MKESYISQSKKLVSHLNNNLRNLLKDYHDRKYLERGRGTLIFRYDSLESINLDIFKNNFTIFEYLYDMDGVDSDEMINMVQSYDPITQVPITVEIKTDDDSYYCTYFTINY